MLMSFLSLVASLKRQLLWGYNNNFKSILNRLTYLVGRLDRASPTYLRLSH